MSMDSERDRSKCQECLLSYFATQSLTVLRDFAVSCELSENVLYLYTLVTLFIPGLSVQTCDYKITCGLHVKIMPLTYRFRSTP